MPYSDLPEELLSSYLSSVRPPMDLDRFWSDTLQESRSLGWPAKVEPVPNGLVSVDTFDVTFAGFAGEPIKAWYHRPHDVAEDIPVVVNYGGYGGGRSLPHQTGMWVQAGHAVLAMDNRGQGADYGWVGDTPDSSGGGTFRGLMTSGMLDPETYYLRRLFTDAVLAVDAARSLPQVDASRVAVTGTSQGGGMTLAVAGLSEDVTAAMPDVPFLSDFPRAMMMASRGPYLEIAGYLASHRHRYNRVLEVLAYFDAAVLAQRARAPALFSVALMDQVCPPSTVYAAYNAYGGEKQICVYRFNDHEGGQFHHEAEQLSWLGPAHRPSR